MVSASTSSAKLNSVDSIGNGTAESIVDAEKKIVNEFVYLLDKSKQLFNGLKWVNYYFDYINLLALYHYYNLK